MELEKGTTAVITGAASGIGAALADRFAAAGLDVVIADVDEQGMETTAERVRAAGVEALTVRVDVSDADAVAALATEASGWRGPIRVVCNNAGVTSQADPWLGPLTAWEWVVGVNLWGVIHGVRAFLPHLVLGGGGHIVNTASMAGLIPGLSPSYDATKHAVVALTENLYLQMRMAELPVGVSCLCPGWVNTGISDAERNWPAELGERPDSTVVSSVIRPHFDRALAEGLTPAAVADLVASAIEEGRYWVFPHPDWMEIAGDRWDLVRSGAEPEGPKGIPGMPPAEQLRAEVMAALQEPADGEPAPES